MSDPDTAWLLFDFGDPGAVAEWDSIGDRVMGGVSSSRLRHDPAGHAVFEGNVTLERNGGFASLRALSGQSASSLGGPIHRSARLDIIE